MGMIKDVEDLRTGLLGDDSFLATSQNFLNDAQDKVDSVGRFSFASVDVGGRKF